MLVLSRKEGESVQIGDVMVTVIAILGNKVRLGVEAPKNIAVHRCNNLDQAKRDRRRAAMMAELELRQQEEQS